jgi:hypothetical protein
MYKKIFIICISLIFSLVSFELFLKFSPFEYGVSPVVYDKKIGMWHKKNFENHVIRECYRTKYIFDNKGLPVNIDRYDKSKKDVILLGDSFIEALMVENENIIHNSLSKEFQNKYNFMNYGLSGSSPIQQFVILKDKVDLNNTKHIIQFINLEGDLLDADRKNLDFLARPKVHVEFESLEKYSILFPRKKMIYDDITDFLGNYQVFFFLKKSLYYLRDNIIGSTNKIIVEKIKKKKKLDLSKNWLNLKGSLYQINKLIKANDIKIKYIVIIKSINNENSLTLKEFFIEKNIDFIFLNELVKKMNLKLESFKCDGHWNDSAHKNIAKIIKTMNLID